jgi:hypothetical protein
MRRLTINCATFSTVESGVVVATALTITSLALIRLSPILILQGIRAHDKAL